MKNEIKKVTYAELTKETLAEYQDCYWKTEDEEQFDHSDIEEAIYSALGDACLTEPIAPLVIEAARPIVLCAEDVDAQDILERTLEHLDEEYGNPDGGWTEPTEAMKKAAQGLAEAVAKDYTAWVCDRALMVTLEDPMAWIKENQPGWIEGAGAAEEETR